MAKPERYDRRYTPSALAHNRSPGQRDRDRVLIAFDIVASFTDAQAVLLHKRLTGTAPGSITELLHA